MGCIWELIAVVVPARSKLSPYFFMHNYVHCAIIMLFCTVILKLTSQVFPPAVLAVEWVHAYNNTDDSSPHQAVRDTFDQN